MSFAVTAIISVVGTAVSMKAMHDQAKAAEYAAEHNAQVAEQQAAHETELAAENARRKEHENGRIIALQREAIAANGLAMTGTPLAMLGETVTLLQRDIMDMGYENASRVRELQNSAAMSRWEGETTASAMRTKMVATGISGVASAAGGYAGYTKTA